MPKVSVVIPAYNAMAHLPETLESILRQTFTDFEVLIINDGSSDQIIPWTKKITDSRVKLISQANQGVSVARNTGINYAQGDYVAFIDADDLWEATKLEQQVQYMETHPEVGLCHTWLFLINEQSQPTGRVLGTEITGNIWQQLLEKNVIACSSTFVRRNCFRDVGSFDRNLRVAEDWDMWLRIAAKYPIGVIKEPLVSYRLHPQNKSKKYASRLEDLRLIIEKAFQSVPFEQLHLRNRSYGHMNLCIAWKCLQSSDTHYKKAKFFQSQALAHYPQLRFSREYIRLSLALAMMHYLGLNSYHKIQELTYMLQRSLGRLRHLTLSLD
ncbi:glycosyltransferase family 2 protein [Calothrix sp. 336/3]|uniref:glycosyltransferase family 2 protein n=1 Tax=Calothrix sp. 336/3 TaxID=1337936 RepID=UPI0004E2CCA1|nr:glycosyltransferase [Calothrix sp. 336/3]AKG21004.1 glycosyl transferase family A [Calothrix sp. 336/3]